MEHTHNKGMIENDYLTTMFQKTFQSGIEVKFLTGVTMFFYSVLAEVYAFFDPINIFIILTIILVVLDLFAGILASKYPKDKTKKVDIESTKLARTASKLAMYSIAIISCHAIGNVFAPGYELSYIAGGVVALTEGKSLDEKIKIVTGVSFFEFIKDKIKLNK